MMNTRLTISFNNKEFYWLKDMQIDELKNICNIIKGIKQKQRQGSYKSRDL